MAKRLRRSKTERVWAGVCGGIGEFLGTDPVAIRLLWIVITALSGFFPGLIAYIIALFVIPEEGPKVHEHQPKAETV